jgi:hypothetical protein
VLCFFDGLTLHTEEASLGKPAVQSIADIPKEYEIGEKSLSPNGRFAILYPIRGDDSAEVPPNLLVCLKPYSVLEHLPKEVSSYHILDLYYLACCGVKLVVARRLPGA